MRSSEADLLVIAERFAMKSALRLGDAARAAGVEPAFIVPEKHRAAMERAGSRHLVTEQWTLESLDALISQLGARRRLGGITSVNAAFIERGELGAASLATIARRRGLPFCPPEALWQATNKHLMRLALRRHGVHTVRHALAADERSMREAASVVGFPAILKPVTGHSSSFVYVCRSVDEAVQALAHYHEKNAGATCGDLLGDHRVEVAGTAYEFLPRQQLLVEQFIDGREVSAECVCGEDTIDAVLIHDKLDVHFGPYSSYENLMITPPVRLSAAEDAAVRNYAVSVLRALGLRNTFCHVEMRLEPDGTPSIIEVNPRVGGIRIVDSLRDARGIDFHTATVALALGRDPALSRGEPRRGYYGMSVVYPPNSGVITTLAGLRAAKRIPGVLDVRCVHEVGDRVAGDFEEVFLVQAWIHGESADAVLATDAAIRATVNVEVAPAT